MIKIQDGDKNWNGNDFDNQEVFCSKEMALDIAKGKNRGEEKDWEAYYILSYYEDEQLVKILNFQDYMFGQGCLLHTKGQKFDYKSYDAKLLSKELKVGWHNFGKEGKLEAMLFRLKYPYELEEDSFEQFVEIVKKNKSTIVKSFETQITEEVEEIYGQLNEIITAYQKNKPASKNKTVTYKKATMTPELESACSKLNNYFDEKYIDEYIKERKIKVAEFSKILLKDEESYAPAFIVKCAIVPYLGQYETPKQTKEYRTEMVSVSVNKMSDYAASLLDKESLNKMITKNFPDRYWSIAYGRYGTENMIQKGIFIIDKKMNAKTGCEGSDRIDVMAFRGAVKLSPTYSAIEYFNRIGQAKLYAQTHMIKMDDLMYYLLSKTGLDKDGTAILEYGDNKIKLSLTDDLDIELYDIDNNKKISKLPNNNSNSVAFERAKSDIKELNFAIEKATKLIKQLLNDYFIAGTSFTAQYWKDKLYENKLFNLIARDIIWSQGNESFIISRDSLINSQGNDYALNENEKIKLAHPMEMDDETIKSWQIFLLKNEIVQPFYQIWEPVIDENNLKKNRFKDIELPIYDFVNLNEIGIKFYNNNNKIGIEFKDCNLTYKTNKLYKDEIRKIDTISLGNLTYNL